MRILFIVAMALLAATPALAQSSGGRIGYPVEVPGYANPYWSFHGSHLLPPNVRFDTPRACEDVRNYVNGRRPSCLATKPRLSTPPD